MTLRFAVHDDTGDIIGTARTAGRVPALVNKALMQNLRLPNGPLDGRFGRINISLLADGRYVGQQTLQGIHLHPMVRAKVARRCADALEAFARDPEAGFIPFA